MKPAMVSCTRLCQQWCRGGWYQCTFGASKRTGEFTGLYGFSFRELLTLKKPEDLEAPIYNLNKVGCALGHSLTYLIVPVNSSEWT